MRYSTLMLAALFLPAVAVADLTKATLYPSHAELTWGEIASVQSGSGEVVITGLPASLRSETLSVDLSGVEGVRVRQVVAQAERSDLTGPQQEHRARKTVTIHYDAPQAGELDVRLRFVTPAASWRSEYEARLKTALPDRPGGELELEHVAVVRQETGLDWDGVQIRLATSGAMRGTAMPELTSWIIPQPFNLVPALRPSPTADSVAQEDVMKREAPSEHYYELDSPGFISGSGEEGRHSITTYRLPAEIETWVSPLQDPAGYLHVRARFESEIGAPGGQVTLYRDGEVVGRSYLPQLAMSEDLSLGFGVDERVRVEVVNELERAEGEGVWVDESVLRRQNRFVVTNDHQGAIRARVFDRLPVSNRDAITVKPMTVTKPAVKDFEGKKGVMAWDLVIQPGSSVSIHSGFEIRVSESQPLPRI